MGVLDTLGNVEHPLDSVETRYMTIRDCRHLSAEPEAGLNQVEMSVLVKHAFDPCNPLVKFRQLKKLDDIVIQFLEILL